MTALLLAIAAVYLGVGAAMSHLYRCDCADCSGRLSVLAIVIGTVGWLPIFAVAAVAATIDWYRARRRARRRRADLHRRIDALVAAERIKAALADAGINAHAEPGWQNKVWARIAAERAAPPLPAWSERWLWWLVPVVVLAATVALALLADRGAL